MPLRVFLSRLIWMCVIPMVALAAYLAISNVQATRAERDLVAKAIATNFSIAVDKDLNARIGALNMLAVSPLLDDPAQWKNLYEEAQGFRQSFGSHVILAGLDMQMLFNTRAPFGAPLPKIPRPKGRAAAPTALETGKPAVGDILFGPVAKEPLVAIAVPAVRDGRAAALLLAIFETRQFQTRLEQVALPSEWSLSLLDGNNDVIARRAPEGMDSAVDVDAAGRFAVKLHESEWSVVLEIPRHAYRAPLIKAGVALAAAILVATLVSVIGARLASRRLSGAVASLAVTPLAASAPPDIAEIAAVRAMLDDAAERNRTASAILRDSEYRFRRMFQEAPLPLCMMNKGGQLSFNTRFQAVFGYTQAEVPTLAEWWPRAYPDAAYRAWVIETWKTAVERATRQGTDIEAVEYRVTCKDGAERIMLISGNGLGDDFIVTFFDVTERRMAEEEIRHLNADLERRVAERTAELEQRNRDLDDFAYIASHDLKEPLRGLHNYASFLQEDYGASLDDEGRRYLERMQRLAERLSALIDGLLAYSRLGTAPLPVEPTALGPVVDEVIEDLKTYLGEHGVQLTLDTPLPRVVCNAARVGEVFQNLIVNAAKYNDKAEKRVEVGCDSSGAVPIFYVRDNGIGIPEQHRDTVFRIFKRLHEQSKFGGGTGAGLTIVKKIVERHGGRIWLDSTPGQGTTFYFTLTPEA